jgi:hypothetical protein
MTGDSAMLPSSIEDVLKVSKYAAPPSPLYSPLPILGEGAGECRSSALSFRWAFFDVSNIL